MVFFISTEYRQLREFAILRHVPLPRMP